MEQNTKVNEKVTIWTGRSDEVISARLGEVDWTK